MNLRKTVPAVLFLLLVQAFAPAQEPPPWDREVVTAEALGEALARAVAAQTALAAGDLERASQELGGVSLAPPQAEEWSEAVRQRVEALDPKLLAATLQEASSLRTPGIWGITSLRQQRRWWCSWPVPRRTGSLASLSP